MTDWDKPFDLPVTKLQGQGFGRRAVAYIIDYLIHLILFFFVFVISGLIISFISYVLFPEYEPVINDLLDGGLSILLSFILSLVYFAGFEGLFGATPGKYLLSMRVVTEDGRPCGLLAAVIRGVLRFIDAILFAIPAYLSMSSSDRRQRLGDKVAHTVVVNKHDPLLNGRRSGWYFLLALLVFLSASFLLSLLIFILNLSIQPITEPNIF